MECPALVQGPRPARPALGGRAEEEGSGGSSWCRQSTRETIAGILGTGVTCNPHLLLSPLGFASPPHPRSLLTPHPSSTACSKCTSSFSLRPPRPRPPLVPPSFSSASLSSSSSSSSCSFSCLLSLLHLVVLLILDTCLSYEWKVCYHNLHPARAGVQCGGTPCKCLVRGMYTVLQQPSPRKGGDPARRHAFV